MILARAVLWALVCTAGAGCASRASEEGTSAAPRGGATCAQRQHLTRAELAASPRGDRELEALAAALGGTVAGEPALYERLVRDLGAIRAADPSLAHVTYRTGHDGRTLMLEPDADARERILAGRDPLFEALRAKLHPTAVSTAWSWVTVTFDRVYDLARLRDYYRRIRGVNDVGLNVMTGDGPTICVDREPTGEGRATASAWTYFMLDAGGDCPAGCTTLRVVVFRTQRAGVVERLGASSRDDGTGLPPALAAQLASCQRREQARAARPTEVCNTASAW